MRTFAYPGIGWVAALLVTACGGSSSLDPASKTGSSVTIENPTGNCVAPDSGGRAGYHHPGDTQWLPDCKNPLSREYWRVFATTPETAYLMPRPDGYVGLQPACTNEDHPLHPVVLEHSLCKPASSPAEVARINAIHPRDALAIAHELHASLRFVATDDGLGIEPFPIPSDIIDACKLHANDDLPELAAICQREEERLASGQNIGFRYEGPGAVELAKRLNELYGID